MKIKNYLSLLLLQLLSISTFATSYTWTGTTSTNYGVSTNWNPNGVPNSGDLVTIVDTINDPVLDSNRTVLNFTMTSGTFNLGGFTFTVNTNSWFDGGTISNGLLRPNGLQCKFQGTTFDAEVNSVSARIYLHGSIFNEPASFQDTGYASTSGTGGNVFNDVSTFIKASTAISAWALGAGNVHNGDATFINYGNNELYATGGDTTYFNGNIIVASTDDDINFGGTADWPVYLASGKTIQIHSGIGFSSGTLQLRKLIQLGSTAQNLSVTGTAIVNIINSTFNGKFTLSAPVPLAKGNVFQDSVYIKKIAGANGLWDGGNTFNAPTTIHSRSNGQMRLATTTADKYNSHIVFLSDSTGDFRPCYTGSNDVKGNLTATGHKVELDAGSGEVRFTGTASQTIYGSEIIDFKKIKIDKASGNVTCDTAITVSDTLKLYKGNLITTATKLLTMKAGSKVVSASDSSFVSGPVKKTGNTAFVFPTGKNTSYRAIEITTPSSATDAFTGEYFNAQQTLGTSMDTTINFVSDCNYWKLDRNSGSSNITPKFSYSTSTCDWIETQPIHIAYWNGTKWIDKGDAVTDGSNKKTSTSVSSYGYFSFSYKLKDGDACQQPKSMNASTSCQQTELLFKNNSYWLGFTADSLFTNISFLKPSGTGKTYSSIKEIKIYNGNSPCYNNSSIKNWNFILNDSTENSFSVNAELTPGISYLIEIVRFNSSDSCSVCNIDSTYLNICLRSLSNSNNSGQFIIPCSLLSNGDFESCDMNCVGNNYDCPFQNTCVPGWDWSHGSAQIEPVGSSGSNIYATCWSARACFDNNHIVGEGILSHALGSALSQGNQYILSVKLRMGSGSQNSDIDEVNVEMTGPSNPNFPISNPSCASGDDIPAPPNTISMLHLQNYNDANWTTYSVCFIPTFGYDRVWIYPVEPLCPTSWIDVDDVAVFKLNDFGPDGTEVCSGSTITLGPPCPITLPGISYSWSGPSGLSCYNCPNPQLTVTNTTNDIITLGFTLTISFAGYNNSNCSMQSGIEVIVLPASTPPYIIVNPTPVCEGQPFSLSTSFGTVTLWTFPSGATSTSQILNLTGSSLYNGTFAAQVNSACGPFTISTTVQVFPSPTVTISASGPLSYCIGNGPILTANATGSGITYQWFFSNDFGSTWNPITGATSDEYTPTQPGQYQVIVTNSSGCTASEIVEIEELENPADFTINNDEYCMGDNVCFSFSPTADQDAYWNFGDGSASTLQTTANGICYPYSSPGTYIVTLTVINTANACTTSTSQSVTVYPSTAGYNPDCCIFNSDPSYYDLGDTEINPSGTNTVTWSGFNVYPKWVNGVIVVKSGKTLEIFQHNMQFSPKSKIIVERGATLIIDQSSLTGRSFGEDPGCWGMWEGIEVWGDPTKSHGSAGAPFQGKIEIKNSTQLSSPRIEDAHNAVVLGKPNGSGGFDLSYSGGIIIAEDCFFWNNASNIRFAPYGSTNISRIERCEFKTLDPMLDPGYTIGNSYTYPDQYNPFYAPANVDGRTAFGINAWGVKRVKIEDCTFDDVEVGIQNFDSKLNIYNNDFSTSRWGIRINNTLTPLQSGSIISDNSFNNTIWHIVDVAGRYDHIGPALGYGKNEFNPSQLTNNIIGIALNNASGFNMIDNNFNTLNFGAWIIGSGTIGGYIGYLDEGNNFSDCSQAIFGLADNSALRIHCNNFSTSNASFYNLYSWRFILGTVADQGSFTNNPSPSLADFKAPAGDRFFEQTANDIFSTPPFDYFRHNLSDDIFVDINVPTNSNVTETENQFVSFDPNDPDEACAPIPCDPPCDHERIADLDSVIDSLIIELDSLEEHIANENTADLIYEIVNNTDAADLKELLTAASPLSDSVLKVLSQTETVLSVDSLKDIFLRNSSLTSLLKEEIKSENETLDSIAKAELLSKQGDYLTYKTVFGIRRQIANRQVSRQLIVNTLIRYYVDNDSLTEAIEFLTDQNTEADKQTIFSTYLLLNMLDSAQSIYNDLETLESIDPDWLTVQGIQLALALDGKNLFDLDSIQHADLYEIADKHDASLATANSRSILKLVFNEDFYDDFDEEGNLRFASQNTELIKTVSALPNNKFELIPNPATDIVTVSYNLPGLTEKGIFELSDVLGRIKITRSIMGEKSSLILSLKELPSGIYFCRIYDDNIREERKLVLTK